MFRRPKTAPAGYYLPGSLVCEVWNQNRMEAPGRGHGVGVCASGHTGSQDSSVQSTPFTLPSKKLEFTLVGLLAPPQGSFWLRNLTPHSMLFCDYARICEQHIK